MVLAGGKVLTAATAIIAAMAVVMVMGKDAVKVALIIRAVPLRLIKSKQYLSVSKILSPADCGREYFFYKYRGMWLQASTGWCAEIMLKAPGF